MKVDRFLDISTDFIADEEKAFLQWLIQSPDVRIIRDNGTSIPVLVETNSLTGITGADVQPLEQVLIRLKYAGDELNFNGWFVDEAEAPEGGDFMEVDIQLDSVANPVSIGLPNGILVQWGDGDTSISASGTGASHTYTATGTYTIRIATGELVLITMNDQPVVTFRNMPEEMSIMQIIGSAFLTTFDASEIPVNMSDLQLQVNALTVSTVNAVLQRLDANGLSTGICYLQEQATTATPTGAGATAKTSLIAKGWTVNTD
jgi:hypothetical protein